MSGRAGDCCAGRQTTIRPCRWSKKCEGENQQHVGSGQQCSGRPAARSAEQAGGVAVAPSDSHNCFSSSFQPRLVSSARPLTTGPATAKTARSILTWFGRRNVSTSVSNPLKSPLRKTCSATVTPAAGGSEDTRASRAWVPPMSATRSISLIGESRLTYADGHRSPVQAAPGVRLCARSSRARTS